MQSQTRTGEARPIDESRSQEPVLSGRRDDAAWIPLAFALQCAKARRLSLTPEVAGFLLLSAYENSSQLPPIRYWYVNSLGQVAWATGRTKEILSGRQVLLELLAAANGSHAGLWRCAHSNAPSAERHAFTQELRNALVPLNRAASLRGLIRLAKSASELFANSDYADESPVEQPSASELAHTPKEAPFARTGVVATTNVFLENGVDDDRTPFSHNQMVAESQDFEVVSHLPPLVVETYQPKNLLARAPAVESPEPPKDVEVRPPQVIATVAKIEPVVTKVENPHPPFVAPTPSNAPQRPALPSAPRGQMWFSLVLLVAAAIAIFGHHFADLRDVFFGSESRADSNSQLRTAPLSAAPAKSAAILH